MWLWTRLLARTSQAAEHARWFPRNRGKIDGRGSCYDLGRGWFVPVSQSSQAPSRALEYEIQHTPWHRGRGFIGLGLGLPFGPGGQLRIGGVAKSQHGEGAMFGGLILDRRRVRSFYGVV